MWAILQNLAVSQWISGSSSLWAYPTILTLHTVGLVMLVGPNTVINLKLLGVGRDAPGAALRVLFHPMWVGLLLNVVTGALLFAADAEHKAQQPVFWIKLACVAAALAVLVRMRAHLADTAPARGPRQRTLAIASLCCWGAAIVAGRLMAYL